MSVGPDLDKWVVFVPTGLANADAVREAMFAAGAGHIGDYSHCSWSVTGIGQFLPHEGASPAIGKVGTVEAGARGSRRDHRAVPAAGPCARSDARRASVRGARIRRPCAGAVPGDVGLGRIGSLARPEPLSAFVARVHDALPGTSWGVRAAGDSDATVSRVAVCGGAGDSLLDAVASAGVQAYVTADLRHHPADEHRRASDVALIDVAHWASEYPWCTQAADLLRVHFGDSLPVRVSAVRTDPWNVERMSNES